MCVIFIVKHASIAELAFSIAVPKYTLKTLCLVKYLKYIPLSFTEPTQQHILYTEYVTHMNLKNTQTSPPTHTASLP